MKKTIFFQILWPIIEGSHKIRICTIPALFFTQKLVTAASKKHFFSHYNSMQQKQQGN
jgi:hypothetical protein